MVGMILRKDNGDMSYTTSGTPYFFKIQRLHELRLSAYNLVFEKSSEATAKLATPVLSHLIIVFRPGGRAPNIVDEACKGSSPLNDRICVP